MSDQTPPAQTQCSQCRHFRNDAKYLEIAFRGLTSLSSAYGSTRSDDGICVVDDYVANEWTFIPHFYRSFYVYQYATSFTASAALAERVLAGDANARQRYLQFLSAGGSDYPIALLKQAGVDMTTQEPLALTMQKMNRVMDEMEKILAKRAR